VRLLRRDSRAVESLPLRLMIVSLVVSMTVMPAAEALDGMRTREFLRRAELQLDQILGSIQTLYLQGPGAARTIDLDFSSESRARFLFLALGDAPGGPNASVARLVLSDGRELARVAQETAAQVSGPDDQGLTVRTDRFGLRLAHVLDGYGPRVCALVVQWSS